MVNEHARHLGRRRLLSALRPRLTRAQLLAGGLCAVLGFALVTQVRQEDPPMASLRNSEVIALLQQITERSSQLEEQSRDLERQLTELQTGSDKEAVAREVADQRLDLYSVLAGTRAVQGPGVQLDIADPSSAVTAAMLLDTVQELRGAGAEAIQVGQVRVVARTAFVDDPGGAGVLAGSTPLAAPYRILAVGDAQSLARALAIPGGIIEQLKARGAFLTVSEHTRLDITARHTPASPTYARPAPSATP